MQKDKLYLDLLDACAKPGCPLCHLSLQFVRHYLDSVLHEYVNDPGVRAELRRARGYCNEHAWWLTESRGSVLGIAILQQDVVETLLDVVSSVRVGRNVRRSVRDLLQRLNPTAECPACVQRRTMEDLAIHSMLKYLAEDHLQQALADSAGLCLPHFRRAVELVEDGDTLRILRDLQRHTWGKLRMELAEFIRKSDYRFSDEGLGSERDSVWRSISAVSAERGVR